MNTASAATPPPTNGSPSGTQPLPEPARSRPDAVRLLEDLLRLLFPEPQPLDVITIDDVVRRYPLTGLGAPALAAFEQSRRIVRARGDYAQAGLGEYHIGLIYFNWDDYRAAANQFAQARQAWSLDGDYAAMCLSHFAQGLALYHAFHNEAAMMQFGRAERLMGRPTVGPPGERLIKLAHLMRPLLIVAQETLRVVMWPEEESGAARGQYLTVPPAPGANDETPSRPARTQAAIAKEAERAFARGVRPVAAGGVPPPISNLRDRPPGAAYAPVPGHAAVQERYGWYLVTARGGDFLPTIPMGTWLLAAHAVAEHPPAGRQYVIVGSGRPALGSIALQPFARADAPRFCYLGYRRLDEATGWVQLFLDPSGRPLAAEDAPVLGVVEGLWYDLQGLLLPEE